MTGRRLKPEEIELWHKVARTAERLPVERTKPEPIRTDFTKKQADPKPGIQKFQIGENADGKRIGYTLPVPQKPEPIVMDKKAYEKLRKGKIAPEARIDLHGMTMDRAHPVLTGFILRAFADGKRLVLVITGKGKDRDDDGPIPVRRGVLRHNVPGWLGAPPLSSMVLQVKEAHARHGGGGAYYVYLRRRQ